MTMPHPICAASAALVLFWAGIACAQSVPDANGSNDSPTAQAPAAADTAGNAPNTSDDTANQAQYVPALNGTGLISLAGIQKFHVLAGGTISGGSTAIQIILATDPRPPLPHSAPMLA